MIKRYDLGEAIRTCGDYWSTIEPSEDGDYVAYADHIEVVLELVEALKLWIEEHAHEHGSSHVLRLRELTHAAIAMATGGKDD